MSQSYSKFYSHIVFHTKNNVKFIRQNIEPGIARSYIIPPLRACAST